MPICKRDGFENVNSKAKDEHFQDNEEVFFCEVTKEIFRDYEDYFRHVMVINSTVWQCEATGRENLTYAEALKSERRAKRKMELFKDSLRPPVMLVIEAAKQSSFKSLNAIVSKFLRSRYFLNEEVLASHKTQKLNTWTVIDIIPPGKNPPPHGVYEQTDKIQYKLKRVTEKSMAGGDSVITVPFDHIRRQRVDFTLENLSMFIKNHVTRVDGILRPKADAYEKYIKERNINFSSVFIGKMPYFQPAKVKKPVQQTTMNKYLVKNQQNQQQQLAANKDNNNKERELKAKVDKEKEREAKAKSLREEMERVRREMLERLAEVQQQKIEKKAKLMQKIEEECDALLTVTDDLERTDQRVLPVYTPVTTLIPPKHFGDALTICEFMHTFAGFLSGIEVFRPNITFHEITRAFTVHELNGPLSNVLMVLLGTVFDLQKEEEEECKPQYLISQKVIQNREPFLSMSEAARAHFYSKRHFSFKINELPIDAYTISEVLRLHLLSSGARVDDRTERWRVMYRNGYYSTEDPGLDIRINHKHILRALKTQPIYSLEFDDIKLVLDVLMAQILSYSSPINLVEERCEDMARARLELKALNTAENKRALTVTGQKRLLTNEYNQQCMNDDVKGDPGKKAALEEKLKKKLDELEAQSERERRKYEKEVEDRNAALFNFLVCLGSDRAYRKYYILESIPGIFVEHSPDSMDSCLLNPPQNDASSNRHVHNDLPKTRKELRAYLLKMNKDEEKRAKSNGIVKQMVAESSLEDKENQENLVNELETAPASSSTEGGVAGTVSTRASTNGGSVVKKEETPPTELTQYDLYMCTGDPANCIVHDPANKDRQRWAYIYKKEDVDSLIDSLNPMGVRETKLREQLTTLRTLIDKHVKKCPLDLLTVDSTNIKRFKAQMMGESQKRSTRNHRAPYGENDIGTEMIYTLTEQILEFESDIYTGDLGRLKVKNMEKWREDLLNGTYDAQVKLQWGPTQIYKSTTTTTGGSGAGGVTTNGDAQATDEESGSDEAMEDGYVEFAGKPYRDPGEDLGSTLDEETKPAIKSEGGEVEIKSDVKENPEETFQNVRNFASALLQVEQAIERRFIKEPFGAPIQKKEVKDKEMLERKMKIGANRLKQWELSLMESTSYSQVLLHLNVLHDCIIWSRSTNKSSCQVCRRVTDPDKMLLCDECNGGTHMFCMKPKMKTIPEGNWYCLRCVRTMGLTNNAGDSKKKSAEKRKRRFIVEEEAVEVNNGGDSGDEDEASSNHSDVRRVSNAGRGRKLKANEIEEAMEEDEDDDNKSKDYDSDVNGSAAVGDEDDVEADEDNEEEVNGGGDDDDDESAHEEDEDICNVCSYEGSDLMCTKCKDSFHLECINLKRPPRYNFICNKCKEDSRKQKSKQQNDDSDDDDDDSEPLEPPPVKRSRQSRTSLRNSLPNGESSEQTTSKSGSSRRSHRRTADNLPLNTASMYELLADIMKHEKAWPFVRPVSQSEVPDYYEIIKSPMDLSKIKSKLNMGEYNLNEQVINDLQLVFSNCDQYNMESNEVYKAGAALEKYVMKRCSELNLNFKPSDMQA